MFPKNFTRLDLIDASVKLRSTRLINVDDFLSKNKNNFYKLILLIFINDNKYINDIDQLCSLLKLNYNNINFKNIKDIHQLCSLLELNYNNINSEKIVDMFQHKFEKCSLEYKIIDRLKISGVEHKKDLGGVILHYYKVELITDKFIKLNIYDKYNKEESNNDFLLPYIKFYLFDSYAQQLLIKKNTFIQYNKEEQSKKQQELKKLSNIFIKLSIDEFNEIHKIYVQSKNKISHSSIYNRINHIFDVYSAINPEFQFNSIEEIRYYIDIFDEFFDSYSNYYKIIDEYITDKNNKINEKLRQINKNIKQVNNNDLSIIEFAFISYCKKRKIYDENKLAINFNSIGNVNVLTKLYKISNKIVYLVNLKDHDLYHCFNSELVENIKNGLALPDKVLNKKDNNEFMDQFKISIKQIVPKIMYTLNLDLQMLLVIQTIKATDKFYGFNQMDKFIMNGLVPVAARVGLEHLFLKDNVLTIKPYHKKNSNNLIKKNKKQLLDILKQITRDNSLNTIKLLELLQEIRDNYSSDWFNHITLVYDNKRFTINMIFFYLLDKLKDKSLFSNLNMKKCRSQSTFLELDEDNSQNYIFNNNVVKCEEILQDLVKPNTFENVSYNDLKSILLKINDQLSFSSIDRIKIISLIHDFKLMLENFTINKTTKEELKQIEDIKQIYFYIANRLTKKIEGRNNYLLNILIAIGYTLAAVLDSFISVISFVIKIIANAITSVIYGDLIEYMDDHVKPYIKMNKNITNNTIKYLSDLIKSNQNIDNLWQDTENERIIEIKKQLIQKDPDFINIFIDNKLVKEILESEKIESTNENIVNFMTKEQFYQYYLKLDSTEIKYLQCSSIDCRNKKIEIFNKIYSKIFLGGFNKDIILDLIKNEKDLELKEYFMYTIVKEIEVGKSDKKSRMGKLRQKDYKKNLILGCSTFLFALCSSIITVFIGGIALPFLIAGLYAAINIIKEILLYKLDLNNYNNKVTPILDELQKIHSPDRKVDIRNISINVDILKNYCKIYLGNIKDLAPKEVKDKIVNFLSDNASSKVLVIKKLKICLDICKNQLLRKNYEDVLYHLKDTLLNIENDLGILDIINRNDHTLLFITAKTILKSIVYGVVSYLSFIKIIINNHTLNILGLIGIITILKSFIYWLGNKFYNFFKIRSITNKKIKKILEDKLKELYQSPVSFDDKNIDKNIDQNNYGTADIANLATILS
jgi:hypothetical protein